MKHSFTTAALLFAGLIGLSDPLAAQEVTWEQTVHPTYGSIWSIPVYDGSNLVVSCETPGVGIKLAKFDSALNQVGSPVTAADTNDTFGNATIADHKHIFQNGCHYLTFSISGGGQGGYLYLVKLDRDLTRIAITAVATNDPPTNDMLMVGDGTNVCVGKFLPGTGHRIYKYDADLNLLMTTNIGDPPMDNIHANGAAATYYNGNYYLVAPDTLQPGNNYRYSRLIFDSNWQCISNKTTILSNSVPALSIVSGLSREPISGSFIMHYGFATNDAGGPIYMTIYDSGWNLLTNTPVLDGQFARPHSVIVGDKLYLGYDGSGTHLSMFSISNIGPIVKINDTKGPLTLPRGETGRVTVEFNPGGYAGIQKDWWIAAQTPVGWFYCDLSLNWIPVADLSALRPIYQGPLFLLDPVSVLNYSAFPPGAYVFYFAVDDMNGVLDPTIWYDFVEFQVEE